MGLPTIRVWPLSGHSPFAYLEDDVLNAGRFIHQKQHVVAMEALERFWLFLAGSSSHRKRLVRGVLEIYPVILDF